jgi:hypothetical protein
MQIAVVIVALALAGCGRGRWQAVTPEPGAVYRYDPPIERYAPGDPGLWVVTARDATPAGRERVARLVDDPDDVVGDGFAVWLAEPRARWLREHPDVGAVVPLQPADRVGALAGAAAVEVRIELAGGASDVQRAGVIAWLADRGVRAVTIGPRTLDATLAPAVARELATLGPVRWIEPRGSTSGTAADALR